MYVSLLNYGDLDNDSNEEVAFNIDGGGTGGVQETYVYRLTTIKGKPYLVNVRIDRSFDRDLQEGLGGHFGSTIIKNRLIEYFPIYRGEDPNCCPSGGKRFILFKWDNISKKLIVENAVDIQEYVNFEDALEKARKIFGL
jgi:hypothetical protein